MLNADFTAMQDAILKCFPLNGKTLPEWLEEYRSGAGGLSEKRLRWDCLHLSKYPTGPLYRYLNDSHIDTALRRIVSAACATPAGRPA